MVGKKSVREFQNEIRAEEKEMEKSVKGIQNEIRAKEKKMAEYGKKFDTTVNGLKNNWKAHGKSVKEAGKKMIREGVDNMKEKVGNYNNEILNQKKENKAAISRMKGDVDLFVSEIDGKRKEFENYAKGPFAGYIKAFWG